MGTGVRDQAADRTESSPVNRGVISESGPASPRDTAWIESTKGDFKISIITIFREITRVIVFTRQEWAFIEKN